MDDRELDPIERQLVSIPAAPAPAGLRASVLAGVNRRLRAERRDRLLARAAGILLIVGIGLNAAVGIGEKGLGTGPATSGVRLEAVTLSAQVVAEATDPETAVQFARRLALLGGTPLTPDDEATIQRQIKPRVPPGGRPERNG